MTNAEKYLKDNVSELELRNKLSNFIFEELGWYEGTEETINEVIADFFVEEAKSTLTEDERVILEFIKNFDYMGRDKKGLYYKLQDEDIKEKTAVIYNLTTSLFQFIKERRRIFY